MKKEGETDKTESCLFMNKQEEFGVDLNIVSGCLCTTVLKLIPF